MLARPDAGRRGVRGTRCGRISTSTRPAAVSAASNSRRGARRDAARPRRHVGACGGVHPGIGDDVRDGEAPAWPQHARGLAQDARLVPGQVDHAVGDRRCRRTRRAAARPRCGRAGTRRSGIRLRRVAPGEREHLVRHVEPDRAPVRTDAPRGDEHVRAGARAEIEHGLAWAEIRDRRRHAATERCLQRRRRRRPPRRHRANRRRRARRDRSTTRLDVSQVATPPAATRASRGARSAPAPARGSGSASAQPCAQLLQRRRSAGSSRSTGRGARRRARPRRPAP